MSDEDRQVEARAARQLGLVTRAQVLEDGLSLRQIRRRTSSGRWVAVDHHVYRMAGAPWTWESRVLAVCLGVGGIASHWTGGHLQALGASRGRRIHVAVPAGSFRKRDGVMIHQYSQFGLIEPVHVGPIPVTPPTVTVMDLCGMNDLQRSMSFVDTGRRLGLFTWTELLRTHLRLARRGRNGSANLRRILNDYFGELAIPDSSLNRNVAMAVEAAGLPRPALEYPMRLPSGSSVRMDLAWPEAMVAVELQSGYHLNPTTQTRDAAKAVGAQELGWTVLPFTVEQWVSDPITVVSAVASALERAGCLLEFAA